MPLVLLSILVRLDSSISFLAYLGPTTWLRIQQQDIDTILLIRRGK